MSLVNTQKTKKLCAMGKSAMQVINLQEHLMKNTSIISRFSWLWNCSCDCSKYFLHRLESLNDANKHFKGISCEHSNKTMIFFENDLFWHISNCTDQKAFYAPKNAAKLFRFHEARTLVDAQVFLCYLFLTSRWINSPFTF